MEDERIILLLDIDGVLNGVAGGLAGEHLPGGGFVWPIPMANALLQAIAVDKRLLPIWCTSWRERAWAWNARADTPLWEVAKLLKRLEIEALFPGMLPAKEDYDWKLASALYYRKVHPERRIVWLEDGFFEETKRWAATDPLVTLVDTTQEPARGMLLAHGDVQPAAEAFLSVFVWKTKEG